MLPIEILVHIFEYLDGQDIINLRKTCTLFADVVKLVRCPKAVVNYTSDEDIVYGFVNCVLLNPVTKILKWSNVTCLFDVDDICKFNGVNSISITGRAYNSGTINIPNIKVKYGNFTVKELGDVKTLSVYLCKKIVSIEDIDSLEELDLRLAEVNSVRNLPNVKKIDCLCDDIDFDTLPNIESIYTYRIPHKFKFSKLKYLSLNAKNKDIPYIASIETLEELDISYSNVRRVNELVNIKRLNIKHTKVTNIDGLINLEELDISNTDVSHLPENNKIKRLVAKCFKGDATLCNIPHLTYLDISESKHVNFITDDNIIKTLIATNSRIYNIDNLNLLEYVDISYTPVILIYPHNNIKYMNISGSLVIDVPTLRNLEYLIANDTPISTLPDKCNIKELSINCSKVVDIPHYIELKNLSIRGTDVTNVNHLTNLTQLDCVDTKINNVSNLTKLKSLYCKGSNILDISNLTQLQYTDINGITSVYKLQKMEAMSKLDF